MLRLRRLVFTARPATRLQPGPSRPFATCASKLTLRGSSLPLLPRRYLRHRPVAAMSWKDAEDADHRNTDSSTSDSGFESGSSSDGAGLHSGSDETFLDNRTDLTQELPDEAYARLFESDSPEQDDGHVEGYDDEQLVMHPGLPLGVGRMSDPLEACNFTEDDPLNKPLAHLKRLTSTVPKEMYEMGEYAREAMEKREWDADTVKDMMREITECSDTELDAKYLELFGNVEEFIRLSDPHSKEEQKLVHELREMEMQGKEIWPYFDDPVNHRRRIIFFRLLAVASAQSNFLRELTAPNTIGRPGIETSSDDVFSSEPDEDYQFIEWSTRPKDLSATAHAADATPGAKIRNPNYVHNDQMETELMRMIDEVQEYGDGPPIDEQDRMPPAIVFETMALLHRKNPKVWNYRRLAYKFGVSYTNVIDALRAWEVRKEMIKAGKIDGTIDLRLKPGEVVRPYFDPERRPTPAAKVHGVIDDFQWKALQDDDEKFDQFRRVLQVPPRSDKMPDPDGSARNPHLPPVQPRRHQLVISDYSRKGEDLDVYVRELDGSLRQARREEMVHAVQMERPLKHERLATIKKRWAPALPNTIGAMRPQRPIDAVLGLQPNKRTPPLQKKRVLEDKQLQVHHLWDGNPPPAL